MKIKILPLIVLAALAATSSHGQRIVEVDNLAALQSRRPISNETVRVRGYTVAGDWGNPRDYYYQAQAATTTNAVMFPAVGGGRYYHPWDGDVRAFGVIGIDFDTIATNTIPDSTTRMQAAINFAETAEGKYKIYIPGGVYMWNSVTVKQCELYGVRTQVERPRKANTIILHAQNPTGHCIVVDNSALDKPNIHDLTVVGRGDVSTPNKKTITTVIDRLTFTVADADAPVAGNRSGYPIQWAMFYTSEGRWLGCGAVTNMSSSAGQTTIKLIGSPEDNFATVGTNLTLTTNEKVVFAPTSNAGGTIYVDPAAAGYCGIYINPGTGPRIADVTVAKFHTCIYYDGGDNAFTVYPIFDGRNNMFHPEFAGFGSRSWIGSVDSMYAKVTVSGPYGQPTENLIPAWNIAESLSITNGHLRRCAFSGYNILSNAKIDYWLSDASVWGFYQEATSDAWIDTAWLDRCVRGGILVRVGKNTDNGGTGMQFGHLNIRGVVFGEATNSVANGTYNYITNTRAAIHVSGPVANPVAYYPPDISINTLTVAYNAGNPKFDFCFDLRGSVEPNIVIDRAVALDGANFQYGPSNLFMAKAGGVHSTTTFNFNAGLFQNDTNSLGLRVNGNSIFNYNGNYLSFQAPISLTNRWQSGSGLLPNVRFGVDTNDVAFWGDPSALYIGRNGNANYEAWAGSNGSPGIVGRAFGGSHQVPSAVGSGQILVQVAGSGYNGTSSETAVRLLGQTLSTFNSTNEAAGWVVEATGSGATTRTPIGYFRLPANAGETAFWLFDARSNAIYQVKSATNGAVSGINGRVLYID